VRAGGDTKTMKSRRTIALPDLCIRALVTRRSLNWMPNAVPLASNGTRQAWCSRRGSVPRWMLRMCAGTSAAPLASVPGLNPEEWTPRELRHSFVSLLSDAGVPIEDVSRLVGHSSTSVTELVYRHQIRPVIQSGAMIMDRLFGSPGRRESLS
jgi:integrase